MVGCLGGIKTRDLIAGGLLKLMKVDSNTDHIIVCLIGMPLPNHNYIHNSTLSSIYIVVLPYPPAQVSASLTKNTNTQINRTETSNIYNNNIYSKKKYINPVATH